MRPAGLILDDHMSIDLAAIVEGLKEKAASFKTDRQALTDNLKKVIADAQSVLADLGESAGDVVSRGRKRARKAVAGLRRGRPPGSKNVKRGPGRPPKTEAAARTGARKGGRKRTMSAEARAKIAAAQKARWAKQKSSTS
jgi:hypothetical protein